MSDFVQFITNNPTKELWWGGKEVLKVTEGQTLVWEKPSATPTLVDYVTGQLVDDTGCYVNTGIYPTTDTEFEIKYKKNTSVWWALVGNSDNTPIPAPDNKDFRLMDTDWGQYFDFNASRLSFSSPATDSDGYKTIICGNNYVKDSATQTTITTGTTQTTVLSPNVPIYIFVSGNTNIEYVTIRQGGNVVYNGHAAYDGTKYGIYDSVSGNFYTQTVGGYSILGGNNPQYLTFTNQINGTSTVSLTNNSSNAPVMYYSRDKVNWSLWDYSAITLSNMGDKVYFYGENPHGFSSYSIKRSQFTTTGTLGVSGNIMTLITRDGSETIIPSNYCFYNLFNGTSITSAPLLPATTLASNCYYQMFAGCTNLTTAPALPAKTLVNWCYYRMFYNCTSLTTAPALPATTLAQSCYRNMFSGCTSLTAVPELQATTLARECYVAMFSRCSRLVLAPELPATTLAQNCYQYMFDGCSRLCYVKVGATTWNTGYTSNWLNGVAATGTFVKPSTLVIGTGSGQIPSNSASGIPTGWTAEDETTNPRFIYFEQPTNTWNFIIDGNWPAQDTYVGTIEVYNSNDVQQNGGLDIYVNQNGNIYLDDSDWDDSEGSYTTILDTHDRLIVDVDLNTSGWYTEFYKQFNDCHDWQTQGYNSYDDCMCTENHTNCPADYLCFTAEQANSTVALTIPSGISVELYKSTDGSNFTSWDGSAITLANVGDKVYLYGENDWFATSYLDNANYHCNFTMTGQIAASGDITTLLTQQGTTTLSYPCTFARLFQYCTSLTTPPALPATTLSEHCYNGMFESCSALTMAPALPATSFPTQLFYGGGCYANMFKYCTSITTSPTLPATTPCSGCYDGMFYGCTNLNTVICLATDVSATDCTLHWLYGVSATGTFTKATSMSSWTTGDSGIPNGWTVVNA